MTVICKLAYNQARVSRWVVLKDLLSLSIDIEIKLIGQFIIHFFLLGFLEDLLGCLDLNGSECVTFTIYTAQPLRLLFLLPSFDRLAALLSMDECLVFSELFSKLFILFYFFLCVPEPLINLLLLHSELTSHFQELISGRHLSLRLIIQSPQLLLLCGVLALASMDDLLEFLASLWLFRGLWGTRFDGLLCLATLTR